MAIRKYIPGATFDPEAIKNMTTAFKRIRIMLNLENPNDPQIEVVAKKIVSLASQGLLDPTDIEQRVITDTLTGSPFSGEKQT